MRAGLWKVWFLELFRGDKLPAMPQEPAKVHFRDKVQVPYTPEEMIARTAAYKVTKATWDKTMKVIIVRACQKTHLHYE